MLEESRGANNVASASERVTELSDDVRNAMNQVQNINDSTLSGAKPKFDSYMGAGAEFTRLNMQPEAFASYELASKDFDRDVLKYLKAANAIKALGYNDKAQPMYDWVVANYFVNTSWAVSHVEKVVQALGQAFYDVAANYYERMAADALVVVEKTGSLDIFEMPYDNSWRVYHAAKALANLGSEYHNRAVELYKSIPTHPKVEKDVIMCAANSVGKLGFKDEAKALYEKGLSHYDVSVGDIIKIAEGLKELSFDSQALELIDRVLGNPKITPVMIAKAAMVLAMFDNNEHMERAIKLCIEVALLEQSEVLMSCIADVVEKCDSPSKAQIYWIATMCNKANIIDIHKAAQVMAKTSLFDIERNKNIAKAVYMQLVLKYFPTVFDGIKAVQARQAEGNINNDYHLDQYYLAMDFRDNGSFDSISSAFDLSESEEELPVASAAERLNISTGMDYVVQALKELGITEQDANRYEAEVQKVVDAIEEKLKHTDVTAEQIFDAANRIETFGKKFKPTVASLRKKARKMLRAVPANEVDQLS